MNRYIPKEITNAPKQGFSSPDASWFKGQSMSYVQRTLMGTETELYNYMDKESVHDLVSEHLSGDQNRRLLIWSLLNTTHFIEEYCGN